MSSLLVFLGAGAGLAIAVLAGGLPAWVAVGAMLFGIPLFLLAGRGNAAGEKPAPAAPDAPRPSCSAPAFPLYGEKPAPAAPDAPPGPPGAGPPAAAPGAPGRGAPAGGAARERRLGRLRSELAAAEREAKLRRDVDEARGSSGPSYMTRQWTARASELRADLGRAERPVGAERPKDPAAERPKDPAAERLAEYRRWEAARHVEHLRYRLAGAEREQELRRQADEARGRSAPSRTTRACAEAAADIRAKLERAERRAGA